MGDGTNITIESGESLTHRLAREAASANVDAWRRYRQLLGDDTADDLQFEEFKGLMPLLHKTPADVAYDRSLIVAAKDIEAKVKAGRGLKSQIERATKALQDKEAELNRTVKALNGEIAPLRDAKAELLGKRQTAVGACQELADLKKEHADVLADFPDVDAANIN